MKKLCAAVGLSTMLAGGLGGCATMSAPSEASIDAYQHTPIGGYIRTPNNLVRQLEAEQRVRYAC